MKKPLKEFLNKRFDEDEAVARYVDDNEMARLAKGPASGMNDLYALPDSEQELVVACNPSRMFADLESKRIILNAVEGYEVKPDTPRYFVGDIVSVWGVGDIEHEEFFELYMEPVKAMKALAAPYRDHPDYDESWGL